MRVARRYKPQEDPLVEARATHTAVDLRSLPDLRLVPQDRVQQRAVNFAKRFGFEQQLELPIPLPTGDMQEAANLRRPPGHSLGLCGR